MAMSRLMLLSTVGSTLLACGGGDGSSPSDQGLAVSDIVGLWTFHITANPNCSGAAGGGDFVLDLTGENRAPSGSGSAAMLNLTTARWGFASQPNIGLASGSVVLSSGEADIRIFKGSDNGAQLSGVISDAHTFAGVLRDPAPGLEPAFVLGSCQFDLSGERDGNTGPPPVDPGPAAVTILTGSVNRDENFTQQTVTLHLQNDGGSGAFKVQVWGLPTSPNGPDTFMGETESVEVNADYDETVTYDVGTASFVSYVLVFTRNTNSATYEQTSRKDF